MMFARHAFNTWVSVEPLCCVNLLHYVEGFRGILIVCRCSWLQLKFMWTRQLSQQCLIVRERNLNKTHTTVTTKLHSMLQLKVQHKWRGVNEASWLATVSFVENECYISVLMCSCVYREIVAFPTTSWYHHSWVSCRNSRNTWRKWCHSSSWSRLFHFLPSLTSLSAVECTKSEMSLVVKCWCFFLFNGVAQINMFVTADG